LSTAVLFSSKIDKTAIEVTDCRLPIPADIRDLFLPQASSFDKGRSPGCLCLDSTPFASYPGDRTTWFDWFKQVVEGFSPKKKRKAADSPAAEWQLYAVIDAQTSMFEASHRSKTTFTSTVFGLLLTTKIGSRLLLPLSQPGKVFVASKEGIFCPVSRFFRVRRSAISSLLQR